MKTKIFFISLIGSVALLASCNPVEPELKELTPETCIEALMPYFPYSFDEEFIFFNDSLNNRIVAKASDSYKDGIYPDVFIRGNNVEDPNSEWNCSVRAFMFNSHINPDSTAWTHYGVEQIAAFVYHNPLEVASPIEILWHVDLRLDLYNGFIASCDVHCDKSEFASFLTDTITLPVQTFFRFEQSIDTTIVDGSCAHIVKNVGIVDFTLDGKTYWRRVKE